MANKNYLVSKEEFENAIRNNNGTVIIKFTAKWCGPCQRIEPVIQNAFRQMPSTVQCYYVDVDSGFEIFSFLKTKRVCNGSIPATLFYNKKEVFELSSYYRPDNIVFGANTEQLEHFFSETHKRNV